MASARLSKADKATAAAAQAARAPKQSEVALPAMHTDVGKGKGRRTVIVASNLPMDITLQLCVQTTAAVTGQFGSVKETVFVPREQFVIRGIGYPEGSPPKGFPRRANMVGDETRATTEIPADFWEKWVEQNNTTDLYKNGALIAHQSLDHLAGEALDTKHLDSGLGPINPEKDRRSPKPMDSNIKGITTALRTEVG